MNKGRYFELDLEASRLADGLAVFSYTQVINEKSNDNEPQRQTPSYPFYLIFSEEGVKFYVHYYDTDTKQHRNSLILELPISSNIEIHDNLTQKLNDIFKLDFPILQDILNEDKNNPSYSPLPIFEIDIKSEKINWILRKLFLDFIFDIEHSEVFKNSADYDNVYVKLKENFLYNAIDNKAEYYYQRRLASIIRVNEISAGKFLDAEKRWIESITDNRSEIAFEESDWFKNPDIELKRIFDNNTGTNDKDQETIKRQELLSYFKEKDNINGTHRKVNKFNGHLGKVFNLFCQKFYLYSENNKKNEPYESHYKIFKNNAQKSSDWFAKKYSFSGTLTILGVKYYRQWSVLIFVLGLLGTFFLVPDCYINVFQRICKSDFIQLVQSKKVYPIILISCFIGLLWLIYKALGLRELSLRELSNILIPRLLAAIMTAWFTLTVSEDVLKGFFDERVNWWMNFLILLFTFFFVYSEVNKRTPYLLRIKKFMRVTCFVVLSLFYSVIAGAVMINFFGPRHFERQEFLEDFYISYVFPENRSFYVPEEHEISFLVKVFCEKILFNYMPDTKPIIIQRTSKLQNIPYHIKKFIDTQSTNDLKKSIKNVAGNYLDEKDYQRFAALTLLCVNEFVKDTATIETVFEQLTNEHLMDYRLANVENLLNSNDSIFCARLKQFDRLFKTNNDSPWWLKFLESADHPTVYLKGLEYLTPKEDKNVLISKIAGFYIYKNVLIQFAFVAMFVGVFLTFMLSERAVNDPM